MLVAFVVACSSGADDQGLAGRDLEDEPTDALVWIGGEGVDRFQADVPIDLSVTTQHPEAHTVHFVVDGVEAATCVPAEPAPEGLGAADDEADPE
jgi:hypothetical protein